MQLKAVLLAILFAVTGTSFASALTVDTGQGTQNAVISDGVAYAIPIARICGMSTLKAGPARFDVGRDGKYVTIGGLKTNITCVAAGGGGTGSNQTYKDEWKDSDLVDDDGNVTMGAGETKTEHESTDSDDSGFEGGGPDSIDG